MSEPVNHNGAWKPSELRFIEANWHAMSDEELADALGRSGNSVQAARQANGMLRSRRPHTCISVPPGPLPSPPKGYTPEQIAWAERNWAKNQHPEAGAILTMHRDPAYCRRLVTYDGRMVE